MYNTLLDGVTVIDVAEGAAAAELVRILADLGARVTRVLPAGDDNVAADAEDAAAAAEAGSYPTLRQCRLDLTQAEGRDAFDPLLAGADILIETRAPGRLAGLGYGQARRSALNPGLVQCQIGRSCADPDRTDSLAVAALLLAALTARRDDGEGRVVDVDPVLLDSLGSGEIQDEAIAAPQSALESGPVVQLAPAALPPPVPRGLNPPAQALQRADAIRRCGLHTAAAERDARLAAEQAMRIAAATSNAALPILWGEHRPLTPGETERRWR